MAAKKTATKSTGEKRKPRWQTQLESSMRSAEKSRAVGTLPRHNDSGPDRKKIAHDIAKLVGLELVKRGYDEPEIKSRAGNHAALSSAERSGGYYVEAHKTTSPRATYSATIGLHDPEFFDYDPAMRAFTVETFRRLMP